jgi:heat shock protein HtpX
MRHGFFLRVALLVVTNLAVLLVLTVAIRVFNLEPVLENNWGVSYQALLIYSLIIGFAGAFISLAMSKWLAKMLTRARVIDEAHTPLEEWLLATVRRLSQKAGIKSPEVAIYESPDMNAFATGARRNKALLAVSSGLLQRMDKNETEAVLGHEVAHAANGDMITLTLIQGVLNTFVIFLSRVIGSAVDRLVFRNERGHGLGFWLTVIVTQLLLGILASLIVLAFSRRREFRADLGSAQLNGPRPMISALRRLESGRTSIALPDSFRSFGIRGNTRSGLQRLFSSHPPIQERIARLEAMSSRDYQL